MKKLPLLLITFLHLPTFVLHASSKKFLIAALHGNVDGLKKELFLDRKVVDATDHEGNNAFQLAVEARAYRLGIEQGESYCQNSKPLTNLFMEWFRFNRANLTPNEKANNKKLREQECLFTIFNTYRETIEFLLNQHSFDPDKHTKYGMTALHTAALSNDQTLVLSLLKHGASPFTKSKPWPPAGTDTFLVSLHNGATALHFTAMVNTSRAHGAQKNIKENTDVIQSPHDTPNHLDIQRMKKTGSNCSLQNKYASIHQAINAQDHNGLTPLMVAIEVTASITYNDYNKHCLEANALHLLKNPAIKLTLKNTRGETALDLAKKHGLSLIAYKIEEIIKAQKQQEPPKRLPVPKRTGRPPRTREQEADLKQYLVFGKKS